MSDFKMNSIDPITRQVIRNALVATAKEHPCPAPSTSHVHERVILQVLFLRNINSSFSVLICLARF